MDAVTKACQYRGSLVKKEMSVHRLGTSESVSTGSLSVVAAIGQRYTFGHRKNRVDSFEGYDLDVL
jgi:hypothetical protein